MLAADLMGRLVGASDPIFQDYGDEIKVVNVTTRTLLVLRNRALIYVKDHPQHHLSPLIRISLYEELEKHKRLRRVRGWWALITARSTFHIFETAYPKDKITASWLNLSEKILTSHVNPAHEKIKHYKSVASTVAGSYWGEGDEDFPQDVFYSGWAAYKALLECTGSKLLKRINFETYWEPTIYRGQKVDDEEIANLENADTASASAMASAYRDNNQSISHEALRTFWEWWLTSAFDEALEKSSQ